MNSQTFTAIDFETATNEHDICQVGVVRIDNGVITKEYSHLIQPPGNRYDENKIRVHGITPQKTESSLSFPEIWEQIREDLENRIIVAHNAATADEIYLIVNLDKHGILPFGIGRFECTYKLLGYKLEALCYGYDIPYLSHHDALFDAQCCAQFYLNYINGVKPNTEKLKLTSIGSKLDKIYRGKLINSELLTPSTTADHDSLFFNRKIVMTGDFAKYGRNDLAEKLQQLGADIDTSISKHTSYIILGENPGPSKMKKVESLLSEGYTILFIQENDLDEIFCGNIEAYRIPEENIVYKKRPKRILSNKYLLKNSLETKDTLISGEMSLHLKEAYISQSLSGEKHIFYQMLGNLGCSTNTYNEIKLVFEEQGTNINLYVVSDQFMTNIKEGQIPDEINYIQKRIDEPNSGFYTMPFISESDLLEYFRVRFTANKDEYSLSLLEKYLGK